MDKQLITIRLNRKESFALVLLFERFREVFPKIDKEYGEASKMLHGLVAVDVFQDEFEAVEVLDNILRQHLEIAPFA